MLGAGGERLGISGAWASRERDGGHPSLPHPGPTAAPFHRLLTHELALIHAGSELAKAVRGRTDEHRLGRDAVAGSWGPRKMESSSRPVVSGRTDLDPNTSPGG